uniref:DUF19 domain-containing protein n=1 Tax=Steinernema glaseri TaxID=37863 RepID=A0A1I7ZSN1_9BILA
METKSCRDVEPADTGGVSWKCGGVAVDVGGNCRRNIFIDKCATNLSFGGGPRIIEKQKRRPIGADGFAAEIGILMDT